MQRMKFILLYRATQENGQDASATETHLEAPISKLEAWVKNTAFTFSGSRVTMTSEPSTVCVKTLELTSSSTDRNHLRLERCELFHSCPSHPLYPRNVVDPAPRALLLDNRAFGSAQESPFWV